MKFHHVITEKNYTLIIGIALLIGSIFTIIRFFPQNSIGYDLTISLMATAITVIILNLMLIIREDAEWKQVRQAIKDAIDFEVIDIAVELARFLEPEDKITDFIASITSNIDRKTRNETIITYLRELQNKEKTINDQIHKRFLDEKALNYLFEAKHNITDIQVKYNRFVRNPDVVEILIDIQFLIDSINKYKDLIHRTQKILQTTTIPSKKIPHNKELQDIIKEKDNVQNDIIQKIEKPIKALLEKIIIILDEEI